MKVCLPLLVALAFAAPSAGAWAQAPAPGDSAGVSLQRALVMALEKNPDLQISASVVSASQGALQSAGGAFDRVVRAQASVDQSDDTARNTTSSVELSRRLRSGTVLGAALSGDSRNVFDNPQAFSTASLGVNITFPLLRGRGEKYAAPAETMASMMLRKSQLDLRHATSRQILETTAAYWNFRAALEALAAQREAEARAGQMVADIRKLIAAGERPAADIAIIDANLTAKRTERITAEQAVVRARVALATELGLEHAELSLLQAASDDFPGFDEPPPLIEATDPLVARGLAQRLDLASAAVQRDVLRVALESAGDDLKSLLDVRVGVAYEGSTAGENPLQVFGRGAGEPKISATLSYTWDVDNNTARGRLLSRSAEHDQQTLAVRALGLAVGAGIENAVAVYNRSVRQLVESRHTVALYTKIVEDEKKKLQIGESTLLDVVNVETQRQDAVINLVAQRLAYANALVALRYELGELVGAGGPTQALPMSKLFAMGDGNGLE